MRQTAKSKMTDSNLAISVIVLDEHGLDMSIKKQSIRLNIKIWPGMVVHACHSTQEVEAGRSQV